MGGCTALSDSAWWWLQLPVQCMLAVATACRNALLNDGWAICLLSCTNGCRKHSFHLVGTPFLVGGQAEQQRENC